MLIFFIIQPNSYNSNQPTINSAKRAQSPEHYSSRIIRSTLMNLFSPEDTVKKRHRMVPDLRLGGGRR